MSQKSFRSRLLEGDLLIGTMLTLPSPELAEIIAAVGFDWIFVDSEHGPFETADIKVILQAVNDRASCLIRVPAIDEVPIKKALDLGATGIIVPQVSSAEQAAQVVQWSRYPPAGSRGCGLARAHGYGTRSAEYMNAANDEVTVVVQAENREAIANIDSIVKVPGIDSVLIGPYDLTASYGKPGAFDDPEILEAMTRVQVACQSAGIKLGIFGANADAVQSFIEREFNLIVVGVDASLFGNAARKLLDQSRQPTL